MRWRWSRALSTELIDPGAEIARNRNPVAHVKIPQLRLPEASVKSSKSGGLVQWDSCMVAWPFPEGEKMDPPSYATTGFTIHGNVVTWKVCEGERSIKRRRKMRPALMIRQAKLSLPIRDRSSLLRHLL